MPKPLYIVIQYYIVLYHIHIKTEPGPSPPLPSPPLCHIFYISKIQDGCPPKK